MVGKINWVPLITLWEIKEEWPSLCFKFMNLVNVIMYSKSDRLGSYVSLVGSRLINGLSRYLGKLFFFTEVHDHWWLVAILKSSRLWLKVEDFGVWHWPGKNRHRDNIVLPDPWRDCISTRTCLTVTFHAWESLCRPWSSIHKVRDLETR
jgi:hypothetical protein